jgi:cytochrome c biogenesis protein CcdA
VARLLGGAGWLGAGVGFCRGPLLILAGALLTGALGSPAQSGPDVRPNNGPAGLFFLGALCGVAWCPVGAGLFFGVLLPMSLSSGAPLRTALLYGAGYALPVLAVCLALAAGGRLVQLRSAGRRVNVAAGLGLILLGVLAVLG